MVDSQYGEATVRDISTTGVGLLLDCAFPPGTMLLVESWQRGNLRTTLLARVVHAAPQGAGWYHGCELGRPLGASELEEWLT